MRTFITLTRSGGNWSVLAGPEKDYHEHKSLFRGQKSGDEVQIWSSSGGRIKRRNLKKLVTETSTGLTAAAMAKAEKAAKAKADKAAKAKADKPPKNDGAPAAPETPAET